MLFRACVRACVCENVTLASQERREELNFRLLVCIGIFNTYEHVYHTCIMDVVYTPRTR